MKKRVKKLVLNTSNNAHKYIMLRNLFTSLLIYGKVETTEPRAKALKAFAQKKLTKYQRLSDVRELKRWFNRNIMSKKFSKRIRGQLEKIKEGFIITNYKVRFRKGDGALMVRVELAPAVSSKDMGTGESSTYSDGKEVHRK